MGKTAVFVLTILHQLPENPKPVSAIVLCHNRELAYQIKKEFVRFSTQLPDIRTEVIFGGTPISENITLLKGLNKPHIIVGTPGRILGLIKKGDLDLSNIQIFVLDECDTMLDAVGKCSPFLLDALDFCRQNLQYLIKMSIICLTLLVF
jgi:ATP-dependent RNA helicase UAP56/SUB2